MSASKFKVGDRVRYTGTGDWFCKTGEVGIVIAYEDKRPDSLTRLMFQPDKARDEGFGSMAVMPWFLETATSQIESVTL